MLSRDLKVINVLCNALNFFIQSHLINTLPFSYRPLIVHDMYISNSLLVCVKVLIILTVLSISRFYDNYTPRSGVWGVRLKHYTMSTYFCYYGLLLS